MHKPDPSRESGRVGRGCKTFVTLGALPWSERPWRYGLPFIFP